MSKEIYCWACDYSKNTGEGQLARLYVDLKLGKHNTQIVTPSLINFKNNHLNKLKNYKYISPFVGIAKLWILYFQNKKAVYVNYLPLWNFLIFLLLPPETKIGPVTGGSFHSSKNYLRKNIFPFLYILSKFIIFIRYKNVVFSTDLLKKYFNKNFIKKNEFNFALKKLKKKFYTKKIKKDIDLIIYYRNHKNKIYNFPYKLIKKLRSLNLNIHIIGDKLDIVGVTNHGYIDNYKTIKLISRSKYGISGQENIFSIFAIECINLNTILIFDKKNKNKLKNFKNFSLFLDFQKKYFDIRLFNF